MPRRFPHVPDDFREPHTLSWDDLPSLYWKALGITVLLGFVTGLGWLGWRLFQMYVLR
jgi:hypothetical protein